MATDFWLPDGVERSSSTPEVFPPVSGRGVIVNETDLPDEVLRDYFVENASVLGLSGASTFSSYIATGNIMTRPKWLPPQNITEEIIMARELAERDDDIAATIGMMIALAFGEGMQHAHRDEVTVAVFDEIAKKSRIIMKLKEMYREWLISYQVTTATIWQEKTISIFPYGAERQRTRKVRVPLVGIIPSEQIHVLGNDLFGTAKLAYRPFSGKQEEWLREYFSTATSPGRKAEMRREDPILTSILTEEIEVSPYELSGASWVYGNPHDPAQGRYVYRLNPENVQRICGPKGQWQNPRPMLTRNAALLEAKRLLTIMDHALLEGGANFLIVAKKGSDARPALPEEVANLRDTMARASRSGLMVGDHRLSIEVITPDLTELLNPTKRNLLGRKMAMALLRVPDFGGGDMATPAEIPVDAEILSRTITSDRQDLHIHMEQEIYERCADRNGLDQGAPGIWFPKIVLQGLNFFQDMVLGLRDRGDIPRRWAVEAAGYNWIAAVEQRKLEKASGDDKIMVPAAVPFSSPNTSGPGVPKGSESQPNAPGPQDRGGGRPVGSKTGANKAKAPGTGTRIVHQNAGETVRAMWEGENAIARVGENTYAILEEFADTKTVGRISKFEREALDAIEGGASGVVASGPLFAVPVNGEFAFADEFKAVRLTDGVSMILGYRQEDDAAVARALMFRHPMTETDAEEMALRWGYATEC